MGDHDDDEARNLDFVCILIPYEHLWHNPVCSVFLNYLYFPIVCTQISLMDHKVFHWLARSSWRLTLRVIGIEVDPPAPLLKLPCLVMMKMMVMMMMMMMMTRRRRRRKMADADNLFDWVNLNDVWSQDWPAQALSNCFSHPLFHLNLKSWILRQRFSHDGQSDKDHCHGPQETYDHHHGQDQDGPYYYLCDIVIILITIILIDQWLLIMIIWTS